MTETQNSPANEQEPTSQSGNSPAAVQDGAREQQRVQDLMGLANRRLTAQQRAEAERDAAREELDRLRAEVEAGYDAEKDIYFQRNQTQAPEPQPAQQDDDEDDTGEPPPMMMSVNPMRPDFAPRGGGKVEPDLATLRAQFDRLAAEEDMRLRERVSSRY